MAYPPLAPAAPGASETDADLAAPETEEAAAPDLAQGYCVEVYVMPDGTFKVSGPTAKVEASEEGTDASSIGEALKAVLSIVKANPVGDSAQSQFSAGYGEG